MWELVNHNAELARLLDATPVMMGWAQIAIPLVTAAVGAIGNLWASHKNAEAAKEAAKIQVAGTKDAQGYIDRGYAEAKAVLQPYTQAGTTALGSLMSTGGYTMPTGAASAAPMSPTATANTNPLSAWDSMSPEEKAYVSSATTKRNTKNYLLTGDESLDPSTTGLFAPDAPNAQAANPQAAAQAQMQSSYVKMKAPDGTVQPVPSQYVKHFTDLGATVVS